jgi:predicted Zn-dependent protease
MIRLTVFALLALLAATPAHAQFNLNRLLDSAKNIGKATSEIGEKDEIDIGRDLAARLLGAAPLVANDALQRYVNNVGRWLASQTERADLPWQFGVLEAPQLNAFATPGGNVFVTRGLLEHMNSEAELAGTAISTLARQDRNTPAREELLAAGGELFARGLDKSDELEADRLGVVIAARGGYDAYGLPSVLQTLQAMNPEDSGVALMFKTHPAPGERLYALEKMQPMLDAYAGQPQLADRFAGAARR